MPDESSFPSLGGGRPTGRSGRDPNDESSFPSLSGTSKRGSRGKTQRGRGGGRDDWVQDTRQLAFSKPVETRSRFKRFVEDERAAGSRGRGSVQGSRSQQRGGASHQNPPASSGRFKKPVIQSQE